MKQSIHITMVTLWDVTFITFCFLRCYKSICICHVSKPKVPGMLQIVTYVTNTMNPGNLKWYCCPY